MRGLLPSLQSTGCCHRSVSSGSAGPHQLWPAGPRACRPQQLWPRALQHGLGSCGIRAQCLCGMWNPPRSGIEPLSPALEGRLLSTVPAGKSWSLSFEKSPWLFWFPLLDCNFPEGRNFCCGCYYLMHGSCSANPCWMNGLITQRVTEIVERVRDSFDSDTHKGFPGGAVVKNPPAKTGDTRDTVWCLDQKDPLEKEMATRSSVLAREIPRTEEPGHGAIKSWTRPSDWAHTDTHKL